MRLIVKKEGSSIYMVDLETRLSATGDSFRDALESLKLKIRMSKMDLDNLDKFFSND